MKRIVSTALCCSGILCCSTAFAQTSVTLYGVADAGLDYVSQVQTGNGATASRLRSQSSDRGANRFELLGSNGMLQAGNVRPTEVTAWSVNGIATDVPEPFFLERYRHAYAAEIAHFVDALRDGAPVRTTIDDGLAALELAEAAMTSWQTGRVVEV